MASQVLGVGEASAVTQRRRDSTMPQGMRGNSLFDPDLFGPHLDDFVDRSPREALVL